MTTRKKTTRAAEASKAAREALQKKQRERRAEWPAVPPGGARVAPARCVSAIDGLKVHPQVVTPDQIPGRSKQFTLLREQGVLVDFEPSPSQTTGNEQRG